MPGNFDDLIPQAKNSSAEAVQGDIAPMRTGSFDDLIPQKAPSRAQTILQDAGNFADLIPTNSLLDPRYQEPIVTGPINEPTASLGAGFMDTMRNVGRKQYELSGNVLDATANVADMAENKVTRLKDMIFGAPEPDPNFVPSIETAEGNFLSNALRDQASKDFHHANIMAGKQAMNPIDRSGRTSVDDILADPWNIPQIGKFGLETAIESGPEMALAALPYIGPYLFAGSMTQGMAENRAENRGREARDVSGQDLVEAAPFAAISAAAEKIGIKGLGAKGGNAFSRTAQSTAQEGVTEAIQEPLEYVGETLATDKELELAEAGKRSLGGVIGGTTMGGTLKGGAELAKSDFVKEPTKAVLRGARDGTKYVAGGVLKPVRQAVANKLDASHEARMARLKEQGIKSGVINTNNTKEEEDTLSRKITTPTNEQEIDTRFELVEADELITSDSKEFDPELQPRDRARKSSQIQIDDIVSKFDPKQVTESRTSDTGAPIIGRDDNMVESGNGRVAALRRIMQDPEARENYMGEIRKLGLDPQGMYNPILVRRRTTDLDRASRIKFTQDSNADKTAAFSTTERAKTDGAKIKGEDFNLYKGGSLTDAGNAGFVQRLVQRLVPKNQQGQYIGNDGRLSQDGVRLFNSAILANAYQDSDIVQKLQEDTDNNIKAIGSALLSKAGKFAQFRTEGSKKLDITKNIVEAARLVSETRSKGMNISDALNQPSLIDGQIDPVTEKIVRAFFNDNMSTAIGQKKIEQVLDYYLQEANKAGDGVDMLGAEPVTAEQILDLALKKRQDGQLDTQKKMQLENGKTGRKRGFYKGAKLKVVMPPADKRDSPNLITQEMAETLDPEKYLAMSEVFADQGDLEGAKWAKAVADKINSWNESAKEQDNEQTQTAADLNGDQDTLDLEQISVRDNKPKAKPKPDKDATKSDQSKGDTKPPGRSVKSDPSTNQRSFEEQSKTHRPSWSRKIFIDLGINPDLGSSYAPEKQFQIFKKAIKDKYNINVQLQDKTLIRFGLDQMIDLYANLAHFSLVLNLPDSVIGLKGKNNPEMTLHVEADFTSYLGMYNASTNEMHLPQRSNSFAHEWGHALDYFLLSELDPGRYRGLSSSVRTRGLDGAPNSVEESFVELLQAIFFEKDVQVAELLRLEKELEQAKTKTAIKKIQKQISDIERGKSDKVEPTSYYKEASSAGGDYWKRPTEMLARSFEAYIAYKVESMGGDTEVLAKSNDGYMSSAEERFVKTFPRGVDRDNIFRAYGALFDNLNLSEMLDGDTKAAPRTIPAINEKLTPDDIRTEGNSEETQRQRRTEGAIRKAMNSMYNNILQNSLERDRPKSNRDFLRSLRNGVGYLVSSDQEMFRVMEKRYPAVQGIKALANMYVKRPGSSEGNGGQTYEQEIDRRIAYYGNMISKVIDNFNLKNPDGLLDSKKRKEEYKKEQRLLRDAMLGIEGNYPPNIAKAAGRLRSIYNQIWYDMDKNGLEVGFVKNIGYLNSIMDTPLVMNNKDGNPETGQPGFIEQASKVYSIQFDNIIEKDKKNGHHDVDEFLDTLAEVDKRTNRAFNPNGATRNQFKTTGKDKNPKVEVILEAKKKLDALQAEKEPNKAKIKAAIEAVDKAVEDLIPEARDAYAEASAELWYGNLVSPKSTIEQYNPPNASFTKARTLPKEASKLMEEFMVNDTIELISTYMTGAVSEIAYKTREGKRKKIIDSLSKSGVDLADRDFLDRSINYITGKESRGDHAKFITGTYNLLRYGGTISLLPRAVIASIAEPLTVGIRTGRPTDSFRALATIIGDGFNTKDYHKRVELAELMGIITSGIFEQSLMNRQGGTFADSPKYNKNLQKFFEDSFLTDLTRRQRVAVFNVANSTVMHWASTITNEKKSDARRNFARAELAGTGIPRSQVDLFANWLMNADTDAGYITKKELDTPFGQMFQITIDNIVKESIQAAYGAERSSFAKTEGGKMIMGITSFLFSFFENITKATPKRIAMAKREGNIALAAEKALLGYLPPIMMLWAAQTLVQVARTAIFNPDRLKEWEDEDALVENALKAGLSQMGLLGPGGDSALNAYTGVKYQRDLTNILAGPYLGNPLNALEKVLGPTQANSTKSNTTEYNALKGLYTLMSPVISHHLIRIPSGRQFGKVVGIFNMYATSGAAGEHFSEALIGEKGGKTTGNFERGEAK